VKVEKIQDNDAALLDALTNYQAKHTYYSHSFSVRKHKNTKRPNLKQSVLKLILPSGS